MKTHFLADTHFDHEGVLAMSGRMFENIVEHDNWMIDQCINKHVDRNDRLFIIGDFAWRAAEAYTARITCKNIHLIWGNHDRNNFAKAFKSAEDVTEIKIGEHKTFLSHYPHAYWPASHHGSFHLYGHCHRQREETLDLAFPGRRSMDVGVDNALHLLGEYRPFTEDDIIRILLPRPGHDPISFYEEFQSRLPKYQRPQSGNLPPESGAGRTRPTLD
jgi:calcineurin-like phosphoesterase family protein